MLWWDDNIVLQLLVRYSLPCGLQEERRVIARPEIEVHCMYLVQISLLIPQIVGRKMPL